MGLDVAATGASRMFGFLTAPHVAATAFIWIERLVDPCEFSTDLVDGRTGPRIQFPHI